MSNVIGNMIIEAVDDSLRHFLQETVPADDAAIAGLVRIGQLQDDPTEFGINVLTMMNDRSDYDKWPNSVVGGTQDSAVKVPLYAYEVGRGELWWRRFTVEMIQFWPDAWERAEARTQANVLMARAERAVRYADLSGLVVDDYGESPVQVFLVSTRNIESGGPDQFIYRGKIWFQVLTQKA